eukprot:8211759-Pyramimonas_sp.AAC.1
MEIERSVASEAAEKNLPAIVQRYRALWRRYRSRSCTSCICDETGPPWESLARSAEVLQARWPR